VRYVNFIKIFHLQTKLAVRNAKCHFVSEQQLINSIKRNRYCSNYCKET